MPAPPANPPAKSPTPQPTFTLSSADLGGQATEPHLYHGSGCNGRNLSPQLSWANAPAGTKSFAVTIHDPDAPTDSGWWHWVVFDLPATTNTLPTGAGSPDSTDLPASAIQVRNDYGEPGYGGPCPPPGHGTHRYVITVFALGVERLGLDAQAGPAMVSFNLWANTLAKASLIFYHSR